MTFDQQVGWLFLAFLCMPMIATLMVIDKELVYLSLPVGLIAVIIFWTVTAMAYSWYNRGPLAVWKYLFMGK